MTELETEATHAREQAAAMSQEVSALRGSVRECMQIMQTWRGAILAPNATIEGLRELVRQ